MPRNEQDQAVRRYLEEFFDGFVVLGLDVETRQFRIVTGIQDEDSGEKLNDLLGHLHEMGGVPINRSISG